MRKGFNHTAPCAVKRAGIVDDRPDRSSRYSGEDLLDSEDLKRQLREVKGREHSRNKQDS
jgi:hypothetical protein